MIEMTGNVRLNYKYYSGEDLYTEGEIEQELLEIVSNNSKEAFNSIILEKGSWSILYHLSEARSNIIEGLPMAKEDHILEIGAGCGAITGKLAEKAGKVTCIELSKRRSLINANRNKEYNNIEILVGNFEDIEKDLKNDYDYITLIGVFEYAESYINKENACEELLKMVMKHLKKGGKLVVAIENRLGLQYWAGAPEDHLGQYFVGLEGYPNTRGVRTFGKGEWVELLKSNGFNNYTFYYPYPDYKFPLMIYSDNHLPKRGELMDNGRALSGERLHLFDEGRAFDALISNHLFTEFSNSFLIVVENEG